MLRHKRISQVVCRLSQRQGFNSHLSLAFIGITSGEFGINFLSSVGTGFELDLKNYDIFVTRARLMLRYQFAPDVNGYSISMAVSF